MRSPAAERVRQSRRQRHAALSPAERIDLAIKLSAEGLAAFMTTQQVDRATAIRRIKALHRQGRRPSAAAVGNDD
ncbi:MAG: hypothetical protein ACKOEC_15720 [Acidimicrobiia bacterium]